MVDFFADPERLRAISPQFEALGEEVETALEKLQQGLQGEGKCWGGDQPGKEFEKHYPQTGEGSVAETLTELGKLAEKLKGTGNKITGAADVVQNQDQTNADRVRKV
ncbi:hypothetical protein AB0L57_25425 [Nocardia sp. NPDC052254]|uniref:WXG100 family type VII secretion target n=1 Tax=Nocardia sp. NPDC052254 TaxID=3155681 RepID=UPI0034203CE3